MDELTLNFKSSLFSESPAVIGDYIEMGIDSLIDNEIAKEIPIVSTIVGVLKFGKNVHDRNLLKQTVVFINEFNTGTVDEEKKKEYKEKIEKDSKKCEEELGRVILLLNKFIDKEKSVLLAKLYKAYINEIINWKEFCEYSEVVDRLFLQDINLLEEIYRERLNITKGRDDMFRIERLNSLGLIGLTMASVSIINGKSRTDSYINLMSFGRKLMDVLNI